MTRSSNSQPLGWWAGAVATAIMALVAAAVVLLSPQPAQASSRLCHDPIAVEAIRATFPSVESYEGDRMGRLLGALSAEIGASPDIDYPAVTSLEVWVRPWGSTIWLVEDGKRACWATQVGPDTWESVHKAAFGIDA